MFAHIPVDLGYTDLKSETLPEGRTYYYGDNAYPSMTTVLGWRESEWITEWKKRVGEKEAEKIGGRAKRIGSTVHDLFEQYVNNVMIDTSRLMPHILYRWKMVQPILLKSVTNVRGAEIPLFSDRLRVAGKCDLVADFRGVPSIIDYKTSNSVKEKEDIPDYFIQTTGYADMFEERAKMPNFIEQLVIIMMIDGFGPKVFIEKPYYWRPKLYERIDDYYTNHPNPIGVPAARVGE